MSKNITTKTTIENLAAELKKRFSATDTRLAAVEGLSASAFHSAKVDGNAVNFYTTTEPTGSAAFTFDFPKELVLDLAKTEFVQKFTWSEETYPGSTNPNLNNKPVMVLAVKGESENPKYSFLNMAALVDTYKAKTEGKDSSTTVTVEGYEIDVEVNISAESDNQLQKKNDGLYVPRPTPVDITGKADKVNEATDGNLAALDENGNLTDSGIAGGKVLTEEDINDYTAEEITALLSNAD